jgi:hypothetical protein
MTRKRPILVERASLHQIDVQITVVVVIEKSNTGAHNLRHVMLARSTIKVMEPESRFIRYVAKQSCFITASSGQEHVARYSSRHYSAKEIAAREVAHFSPSSIFKS